MTAVTHSPQILVNAQLQTVFDYVSDLSRHPEWSGGELKIEAVSSDPIGVGKEYVSQGQVGMEKNRPNKVQITEYQPPHKFGFVSTDPGFGKVSHIFTFTEQNGGVLVKRTTTVSLNPVMAFFFRFLIYPIIGGPMTKKSMKALKKKLEP